MDLVTNCFIELAPLGVVSEQTCERQADKQQGQVSLAGQVSKQGSVPARALSVLVVGLYAGYVRPSWRGPEEQLHGGGHCWARWVRSEIYGYYYIQHRWIVLFARFDWFLNLGMSSDIHLLAASREKHDSRAPFYQKIKQLFGNCY